MSTPAILIGLGMVIPLAVTPIAQSAKAACSYHVKLSTEGSLATADVTPDRAAWQKAGRSPARIDHVLLRSPAKAEAAALAGTFAADAAGTGGTAAFDRAAIAALPKGDVNLIVATPDGEHVCRIKSSERAKLATREP